MYYLMIALLLSGCAFKADDPKESASAVGTSSSMRAVISWDEQSGQPMSRSVVGSKAFSIPDPISVPIDIPDKIRIGFNTPLVSGKLLQEPRVFITDATDPSAVPAPLRLKGLLDPSGISISGLKTFFSVSKQQKGVIRISLMNAVTGDEEASLGLTLITTPASVEITMIGREIVKDSGLRKLLAPQARFDLLAVFKVKNSNPFRTEFLLPGELKGNLRKDYIRHDYAEGQCHTDTSETRWTDNFGTRFFVMSLDEDVANAWISMTAESVRTVTLEPGEARSLGIYAAGSQVAAFIDSGVPNSSAGVVRVRVACERSCDDPTASLTRDPGDGPGREPRPCRSEIQYGIVQTGIDTHGAYWVLESGSTVLKARNAFLGEGDDPASRSLSFLAGQQTVF